MFGRKYLYSCLLSVMLLLHCHSVLSQLVEAHPKAPASFMALSQLMVTTGLDVLLGLTVNSNIDHLINTAYEERQRLLSMMNQEPPETVTLELWNSWQMQLSRIMEQNPEMSLTEAMRTLQEGSAGSAGNSDQQNSDQQEEMAEFSDQLASLHDIDDVSFETLNPANVTIPACKGILVLGNKPPKADNPVSGNTKKRLPTIEGNEEDDDDDEEDDDDDEEDDDDQDQDMGQDVASDYSENSSEYSLLTLDGVKAEFPEKVRNSLYWTTPSTETVCGFTSKVNAPLPDDIVGLIESDPSGERINSVNAVGKFSKIYIPSPPIYVLKYPCSSEDAGLDESEQQMKNEIITLSSLSAYSHANIISLKAVVYCNRSWVLVMENGGMDLNWWLNNDYQIIFDQRISLARQILNALTYLHGNSMYHRDVKLENILISSTGLDCLVKLIDFGRACSKTNFGELMSSMFGTPGYYGPEHHNQQSMFRESSEMFATGVVLGMLVPCDNDDSNACNILFDLLKKYSINCSVEQVNSDTVKYSEVEYTPFDFLSTNYPHLLSEFMAGYRGIFRANTYMQNIWAGTQMLSASLVASRTAQKALLLLCAQMTRADPENRPSLRQSVEFLTKWSSCQPPPPGPEPGP